MSHEFAIPPEGLCAEGLFAASRRVANATGLGPLCHTLVTGSTNADLVAQARRGNCGPAVLVADHQRCGKGRLGRAWEDDAGNALLVSIRLPATLATASTAVAAVGVAARQAADSLTRVAVLTKWPNDLVVTDGPAPGKLGGVLAEYVLPPNEAVVVGVGINLQAIERQPGATSMAQCGMAQCIMAEHDSFSDRDRLLSLMLRELAARLAEPDSVLPELRAYSATLGTRVKVELLKNRLVVGEAIGLNNDGHLVVKCDDSTTLTITAGDVIHLRPAE